MQHDRFAREIAAILAQSDAARSRRLMRNPLGGSHMSQHFKEAFWCLPYNLIILDAHPMPLFVI